MTITEIAEKAGVSIGTVDRIIHNRGHVSPETRQKIEEIISKYGYVPNPIAKQLKTHRKFVIGVLIPNLESETGYWSMIYDGIQKAASELQAFSVSVEMAEFDRSIKGDVISSAKILLSKNIDALIIAPVQRQETVEFLSTNISIPYVFVDSPLPGTTPLATVAQNPYQSGYCAGRIMSMLCPSANKILALQIHEDTYNLTERVRGFSDFYKETQKQEVQIFNVIRNLNDADNNAFFTRAFSECQNPDGIFVTNDAAFQVAAFQKETSSAKTKIVGYDLLPQNVAALSNGSIDCLISQNPERQGYDAVYTLYRKELMFQKSESSISIPINTYFKENVESVF